MKTAIMTDSNSGITQRHAAELRLHVLPMPFMMDGAEYFEDIDLTQEKFYETLAKDAKISTSQPSPGAVADRWDELLKTHDEVLHIPMSAALSASCESAAALAQEYNGRVLVADNRRISITQRQAAIDAVTLAERGVSGADIKAYLEKVSGDSSIYLVASTLKYLKQGGRITPAAAALGTLLNIKPLLQVQGGKVDAHSKVRGIKQGRAAIIQAMKQDLAGRFAAFAGPEAMHLAMAYSLDREAAQDFKKEVEAAFPGYDIHMDPLSLSVACHTGPGTLALACMRRLDI